MFWSKINLQSLQVSGEVVTCTIVVLQQTIDKKVISMLTLSAIYNLYLNSQSCELNYVG